VKQYLPNGRTTFSLPVVGDFAGCAKIPSSDSPEPFLEKFISLRLIVRVWLFSPKVAEVEFWTPDRGPEV
jgi:hypothetical protein